MLPVHDYFKDFELHSVARGDACFRTLERLIKRRYRDVYEADIEVLAEDFVWLEPRESPGEGACAAITAAADTRLFSEKYFDGPTEEVIGRSERATVLRRHIAELGTFAASDPGSAVELFQLLPLIAWLRGYRYALLTAVPEIRGLLSLKNVPFIPITPASGLALPADQRARWGSYYAQRPITGYVSLERPAVDALLPMLSHRFDLRLLRHSMNEFGTSFSVRSAPESVGA